MALFYIYFFMLNGDEKAMYAVSEEEARRGFEDIFKTKAGTLIRRENW